MDWEPYEHTVRGWMADVDTGVVSVEEAGHDGTGSAVYQWEASLGTMGASGDAATLEVGKKRALRVFAVLLELSQQGDVGVTERDVKAIEVVPQLSTAECALLDKICNKGSLLASEDDLSPLTALVQQGLLNVSASLDGMRRWSDVRRSREGTTA